MREVEYSDAEKTVISYEKFLTDISSKNYKAKFNHEQPINGLNLKKQTKELLGFIYITWWANSKEREKYKKLIHNENPTKEEIKESCNVNYIFKNKKEEKENKIVQNESTMETSIAKYKEESLLKKLLNKILSFFGSKKERR